MTMDDSQDIVHPEVRAHVNSLVSAVCNSGFSKHSQSQQLIWYDNSWVALVHSKTDDMFWAILPSRSSAI